MSFLAAALLTIAAQLVLSGVVGLTDAARPGAALDVVSLTACQLLVHLGFVFLIARLYARDLPLRELLAIRPVSPVVLVLVLVAALSLEMPVAFVEHAWSARFPLTEVQEQDIARVLTAESLISKVVLTVCLAGLWPLGQELFHRGAIFGRLRLKHDARSTTFAVAAFYALSTVSSPRGLPSALVMGLGLTAVRASTKSTIAALVAHMAFMGSGVYRLFRGPADEALTRVHASIGAAIATLAILLLVWRSKRTLATAVELPGGADLGG